MLACRPMADWRGARELPAALGLAALLVVARSLVFVAYEHAYLDSDQAIVGLMAKHLSEGRAFPLYFYGQTYMLGVEAWLAAPWMLIAGPTVAALRLSLVLTNIAVAGLIVLLLHRGAGLRPFQALAAASFFVIAPPFTSAQLVEAQGGNVEPFLYVLLLWWLRHRPWALGAVFAIGVLNREFTLYALPVLIAWQVASRETAWTTYVRDLLVAAIAFVCAGELVEALLPMADLMGPGTRGQLVGGYAASQAVNLLERVRVEPADLAARLAALGGRHFPAMIGGTFVDGGFSGQGRGWMGMLLAAAGAAGVLRTAYLVRSRRGRADALAPAAAWYLLGIGMAAAAGYLLARPADAPVPRYFLLALFAPIGLTALWLAVEPARRVRQAVLAVACVWAAASAIDNARYAERFVAGAVPNPMRAVADALVAERIPVVRAPYWTAYELTFLTGERVRAASTDYVRITEYQELAERSRNPVPRLSDAPCPNGRAIATWYLCES